MSVDTLECEQQHNLFFMICIPTGYYDKFTSTYTEIDLVCMFDFRDVIWKTIR